MVVKGDIILIGRVTGYQVAKNKDGENNVLLLQVEISEPDDVQTVELFRHAGVDYNPPSGSRVFVLQIDPSWKIAVACDDGIEPTSLPDEYEIYGSANGAKVSRVKCDREGNVECNGDDDNAVRYSKLELAFNQLKAEFNSLVAVFNAHTQVVTVTPAGTVAGPPPTPGVPSSADITPSKIETVKMPGVI